MLAVVVDHDSTPPHVDAASHCQAALDRVAQRTSVGIVHKRKKFADFVPNSVSPACAHNRFRGQVHVVDAAIIVGRNYAFGNRLQRVLRLTFAARQ